MTAHTTLALHSDPAAGPGIFDGDPCARFEGQFLGAEKLSAIDLSVYDPTVKSSLVRTLLVENGLEIVAFLEMRVDIFGPIQLADDEVDVLMILLGHVLDQQAPRHSAALDE